MSERELDKFVRELQSDSVELYSFVTANTSEDLSDGQMDSLINELEGDYLSIRKFVINALEV